MGRHANVNAACRRTPCRQAANLFMGVVAAGRHPPLGADVVRGAACLAPGGFGRPGS